MSTGSSLLLNCDAFSICVLTLLFIEYVNCDMFSIHVLNLLFLGYGTIPSLMHWILSEFLLKMVPD